MPTKKTAAPRIDKIILPELESSEASALEAYGYVEARELAALVISELDLSGVQFVESHLDGVNFDDVKLKAATFKETILNKIDAPVFSCPRGRWSDVLLQNSRIGSLESYETGFSSVTFSNCKLGFVNLRGANLLDVIFENCTIEELDLGSAKTQRVSFPGTRINRLDVTHAKFQDFDLRAAEIAELTSPESLAGATLSEQQVMFLAVSLARNLGIRIEG